MNGEEWKRGGVPSHRKNISRLEVKEGKGAAYFEDVLGNGGSVVPTPGNFHKIIE